MQNYGHNDGMLIAYLPKLKILLEADGFNPANPAAHGNAGQISPYTESLADNIDAAEAGRQRVIPVHYPPNYRKVMETELMIAAGKGH